MKQATLSAMAALATTSLFARLKKSIASIVLTLALLPTAAQAVYKYEYTGNSFPVTSTSWLAVTPFNPNGEVTIDSIVTATIYSPTWLTAGSVLTSGMSFAITGSNSFNTEILEHFFTPPNPVPINPSCGPGTPCNPYNVGTFSIGAVDALGRPTEWNLGIDFSYRAPTGRLYSRSFATSSSQDSVAGGYEGFVSFTGALTNHPGSWTVSSVPEAETYLLLLAGLALLGLFLRKGDPAGLALA